MPTAGQIDRARAERLDVADPLRHFREEFVVDDPDLIYLDGNSLGRMPRQTVDRVAQALTDGWGRGLVRSWHDWIDLPEQTGRLLSGLIGADPSEVLVADQTSLNLYKLASAAVNSARPDIISESGNFPSDLYVLDGVARAAGGRLRLVESEHAPTAAQITEVIDERVGLVSISHVGFRTGAIADIDDITAAAQAAGAKMLWDLSHSVGAVPIDLARSRADLAVGCTYKYLNGGPGAPAFLYVRSDQQNALEQPIHGWWGHEDMFSFDLDYRPATSIRRFGVGTPPVLSLIAARSAIELTVRAGIPAIRAKNLKLTGLIIDLFDERLAELGFTLVTPRSADERGSHVSLDHPEGYRITRTLIDRKVIPDFRAAHTIRLGVASLYTRFGEIWDAIEILRDIVVTEEYLDYPTERARVT